MATRWWAGVFGALLLIAAVPAASGALTPAVVVTGQDAGWPEVRAFAPWGAQAQASAPWGANNVWFTPYPTYFQGVRVAVGDVTGDGKPEIVTAPGKDAYTQVRIFDGRNFKQLGAFEPTTGWLNGAFVATGDTDADGRGEVVTGLDAGCCTSVYVTDAGTGTNLSGFYAFGSQSTAGVHVATADLNGDGRAELLIAPLTTGMVQAVAPTGGVAFRALDPFAGQAVTSIAAGDVTGNSRPELVAAGSVLTVAQIRVMDVQTGAVVATFAPFLSGSLAPQVAVGDVDGDGRADLIVSAQSAAGTQVKAIDADTGKQLASFFVLEPGIVPGASLAAGDLDGDGKAEIVLGGGPGVVPAPGVNGPDQRVVVYRADGTMLGGFSAYPGVFQGGVRVGFGDINRDGKREIVTAPGPGSDPEVEVFSQDWVNDRDRGTRLAHFLAYEPGFRGGVSVATGDVLGEGVAGIVTAPGPGRPADVRVFDAKGAQLTSFRAFEDSYTGGVSVAAGDLDADGTAEIVVGALSGAPRVRAFTALGVPVGALIVPFSTPGRGVEVAVADVAGSGRGDVLAADASGSNPRVAELSMGTGAVLQVYELAPTATTGLRLGAGDLNDDGRDEVLVSGGWGGDSTVHILNRALNETGTIRPQPGNGFGFNVAGPTRIGLPIRADALKVRMKPGKRAAVVVARFVDAATTRAGPLKATIGWGDGSIGGGSVVKRGTSTFDVRGTHRYGRTALRRVTVTLTDGAGRKSVAHSTIVVHR